jgi:hypothetical protein
MTGNKERVMTCECFSNVMTGNKERVMTCECFSNAWAARLTSALSFGRSNHRSTWREGERGE